MAKYKIGLYEAFEGQAKEDWDLWLSALKIYNEEFSKALGLLNAEKALRSFKGTIIGIIPFGEGPPGPGWHKRPNRQGVYLASKSRAKEHKNVAAVLGAINDRLRSLYPDPSEIAGRHGFITGLRYRTESSKGISCIGHPFEPFRPMFGVPNSPLVLCAPDAAKEISEYQEKGYETEPKEWQIPEGYRQISNAEWDFRVAKMKRDAELASEGSSS